jgi:hypothetical protein
MVHRIALVAVFFALSGCSSSSSSPSTTPGDIPAPLADIEGIAEDAYDKALIGDFATVQANADEIASSWADFRSQAETDGAGADVLQAMDDAVAAFSAAPDDVVGAGRAANGVSALMDELFGLYDPRTPTEIIALDYSGREVVLDATEPNLSSATEDVDELETTWNQVKAKVVDAGGQDTADKYDAHIDAMRQAAAADDPSTVIDEANVGLELVDDMEKLFE